MALHMRAAVDDPMDICLAISTIPEAREKLFHRNDPFALPPTLSNTSTVSQPSAAVSVDHDWMTRSIFPSFKDIGLRVELHHIYDDEEPMESEVGRTYRYPSSSPEIEASALPSDQTLIPDANILIDPRDNRNMSLAVQEEKPAPSPHKPFCPDLIGSASGCLDLNCPFRREWCQQDPRELREMFAVHREPLRHLRKDGSLDASTDSDKPASRRVAQRTISSPTSSTLIDTDTGEFPSNAIVRISRPNSQRDSQPLPSEALSTYVIPRLSRQYLMFHRVDNALMMEQGGTIRWSMTMPIEDGPKPPNFTFLSESASGGGTIRWLPSPKNVSLYAMKSNRNHRAEQPRRRSIVRESFDRVAQRFEPRHRNTTTPHDSLASNAKLSGRLPKDSGRRSAGCHQESSALKIPPPRSAGPGRVECTDPNVGRYSTGSPRTVQSFQMGPYRTEPASRRHRQTQQQTHILPSVGLNASVVYPEAFIKSEATEAPLIGHCNGSMDELSRDNSHSTSGREIPPPCARMLTSPASSGAERTTTAALEHRGRTRDSMRPHDGPSSLQTTNARPAKRRLIDTWRPEPTRYRSQYEPPRPPSVWPARHEVELFPHKRGLQ